jgi:sortase A
VKTRSFLIGLLAFLAADLGLWIAASAMSVPQSPLTVGRALPLPRIEVHAAGLPLALRIPAIGVDAPIEQVGLTAEGAMDTPKDWWNVGWYSPGVRPGETGNAVIAGHFDSDTGAAVFWKLGKLKPGDSMDVTDDRGETHTFVVDRLARFDDSNAPMQEIFGTASGTHLNLITCAGVWDAKAHRYGKRLVVFTTLQD